MSVYALPSFILTIDGPQSRLLSLVERLFQLCRCASTQPDVHLMVDEVRFAELKHHLPTWLWQLLQHPTCGHMPKVLHGPLDELATVVMSSNQLPCCAWTDDNGRTLHLIETIQSAGKRCRSTPIQPVLMPLLRELLLSRHRLLIHGASVVAPNGIGMLLVANSEGGKTTTAIAIVRRKGRLVADDLSVIDPTEAQVKVHGIPKPLHLRPKTMRMFPELAAYADTSSSDHRSILGFPEPKEIYGHRCMQSQMDAQIIYFLELSDIGPEAVAMPFPGALRNLLLSHAFSANQPLGADSVNLACDTLSHTRNFVLKTGPDPNLLGKWLISHSARHAHGKLLQPAKIEGDSR